MAYIYLKFLHSCRIEDAAFPLYIDNVYYILVIFIFNIIICCSSNTFNFDYTFYNKASHRFALSSVHHDAGKMHNTPPSLAIFSPNSHW